MTTPRDAAYYRTCPSCNGVGESVGMDGYLTDCGVCRTRCVVLLTPDEIAALATPPAPDRTLAELARDFENAINGMHATLGDIDWHDMSESERPIYQAAYDRLQSARQALLAYQPPAPVSRAGAVERCEYCLVDLPQGSDATRCEVCHGREWLTGSKDDAASPPAVAVRAVTDDEIDNFNEMVGQAFEEIEKACAEGDGEAITEVGAEWMHCLEEKYRAALAAAEGRA